MEKPGTLFPRSFGSFLFPLLATMHAGEGAGEESDLTSAAGPPPSPADGGKPPLPEHHDGGGGPAWSRGGGGGGCKGRAIRSPDERLALVARSYGRAMCELAGTPDPEGHALLQAALAEAGEWRGEGGGGGEPCAGSGGGGLRESGVGGEDPAGGGGRERERRSSDARGQAAGEGSGGGAELTELMERTRFVGFLCGGRYLFLGCACCVGPAAAKSLSKDTKPLDQSALSSRLRLLEEPGVAGGICPGGWCN